MKAKCTHNRFVRIEKTEDSDMDCDRDSFILFTFCLCFTWSMTRSSKYQTNTEMLREKWSLLVKRGSKSFWLGICTLDLPDMDRIVASADSTRRPVLVRTRLSILQTKAWYRKGPQWYACWGCSSERVPCSTKRVPISPSYDKPQISLVTLTSTHQRTNMNQQSSAPRPLLPCSPRRSCSP